MPPRFKSCACHVVVVITLTVTHFPALSLDASLTVGRVDYVDMNSTNQEIAIFPLKKTAEISLVLTAPLGVFFGFFPS